MKSRPYRVLALALLLAIGCSAAAAPAGGGARVKTVLPHVEQVEPTTRLNGVIDFDRVSRVSGEISGLITRQNAVEGALLQAGDVVLELNTDLLRKDIDIKRKQQAQIAADQQKVAATLKRLESLLQKNSASRQAYDDALYDHRSLLGKRETLDQELEQLQIRLQKSKVRAPFDGLVLERLKEDGEWMAPGDAATRLASTADVIVSLPVSESLIRFQDPDTPVPVTISPLDLHLDGHIVGFSPVASPRSKNSTLKIAIPYQPGMLQNMSVQVDLPSGASRELLMLPQDALLQKGDGSFVYAVADGEAKMVPVKVVSRGREQVGIETTGLDQSLPVVVDGNDRLRPGQAVTVIAN